MIKTNLVQNDSYYHTYSTKSFYIRKKGTDEIYSDAYDLTEYPCEYEETDIKIEEQEP